MFEMGKSCLFPHVFQQGGHAGSEVNIHGIDASQKGEEDETPLHVMDGRIVDLELFVLYSPPEDDRSSHKGQQGGKDPPQPSKNGGCLNVQGYRSNKKPSMPKEKQVEAGMEDKHGIPKSPVPMVKLPQSKNLKDHGTKFSAERLVASCPPIADLIEGTSLVELPVEMHWSTRIFDYPQDRGHNKKKDTAVEKKENKHSHNNGHLSLSILSGLWLKAEALDSPLTSSSETVC